MESIQTLLGRRVLFFDGGMGTLLQEKGLGPGELPESWNLLHPEDVLQSTGTMSLPAPILSPPTPLAPTG